MSNTPRTDKFDEVHGFACSEECLRFARKLERELASAQEALKGFLTKGQSIGGSHPHLADYIYFPKKVWEDARAALDAAKEKP